MLEVGEPVDVWVLFQKHKFEPAVFFWHGRRIKIEKINLVHISKNGANIFYHFSVSSGGNFYRLKFDIDNLNWSLEAVEEE